MATYNTAFGALPGVETLTGVRQTRQEDEEPRDFLQQQRAQQQAQRQQAQQAPAQTFAQMQAAGQARPAPPMLAPALAVGGVAPTTTRTPLLQQLEQQLQPAAAAAPPAVAVQPMAAQAIQMPAPTPPPLLEQLSQTMGAGRFGLGITSNLISEEDRIEEQGGRGDGGGGNPWTTLPLVTTQLITTTPPPTTSVFTTETPTTEPPTTEPPTTTRGIVTPPATVRLPTTPPPIDLVTTTAPITTRPITTTSGPITTTSGPITTTFGPFTTTPAPVTTTTTIAPTTTTTSRTAVTRTPITIPTFAPVTRGPAPTFSPDSQLTDLQSQIRQILTQMQAAPSPFDSEAYRAQLAATEAELASQYGAQRSALEEQLARQGLSASSIGAGRYGDLAGQQARALAGMRADLLKEAANQQAERQQVLLQGLTSLSGQMGQQEIQRYQADINLYQTNGQLDLDSLRLQQDAAFRGVDLTLEEARDIALQEYQTKTLENQLREITSREGISQRQISSTLLAALIPQLDLSALTPEQIQNLFAQFGLKDLANIPLADKGTPTPTPTSPSGPGNGTENNPIGTFLTPPADPSAFPDGTHFRFYNGYTYRKQGSRYINTATGQDWPN